MKRIFCVLTLLLTLAVSQGKVMENGEDNVLAAQPMVYKNDCFSIQLPSGWRYEEHWGGANAERNEVNFYNDQSPVWFHFVKSAFSFESAAEAAQMTKFLKENAGQHISFEGFDFDVPEDTTFLGVTYEEDGYLTDGFPTYFIVYNYKEGNDTVVNLQHVVYIPGEQQVFYLNCNFRECDMREGYVNVEEVGDFLERVKFVYKDGRIKEE